MKTRSQIHSPAARAIAYATVAALASLLATLVRADTAAIESLIAAERAFAAMSVEHGVRAAFLGNLADDATVFRPGPVNGVRSWKARPESKGVLDWAPSFVELSGDGDLGFSTGPWTFAASRGEAPSAFGHFVTVWRRPVDGPWQVVVDLGVSHGDPKIDLDSLRVKLGPAHTPRDTNEWRDFNYGVGASSGHVGVGVGTGGVGIGVGGPSGGFGIYSGNMRSRADYEWRKTAHEKSELMNGERDLPFYAKKNGWDEAYHKVAAGDLRVYREGEEPDLGPEAASERNAALPRTREWVTRGNGVATSWDLGYSYGLAITPVKGARPDTAAYLHLWRKDDAGEWRMTMDVESPFPKRK
jgi:ketosteroid isomerase-like protein